MPLNGVGLERQQQQKKKKQQQITWANNYFYGFAPVVCWIGWFFCFAFFSVRWQSRLCRATRYGHDWTGHLTFKRLKIVNVACVRLASSFGMPSKKDQSRRLFCLFQSFSTLILLSTRVWCCRLPDVINRQQQQQQKFRKTTKDIDKRESKRESTWFGYF